MRSMGIRERLFAGFGVLALFLIVGVGFTLLVVSNSEKYSEQVINVGLPSYDNLIDLNGSIAHARTAFLSFMLTKNNIFRDDFNQVWEKISKNVNNLDTLAQSWNALHLKKWDELKSLLFKLKSTQESLISQATILTPEAVNNRIIQEILPIVKQISANLENDNQGISILDSQSKELHAGMHKIVSDLLNIRTIVFILLIATSLIGNGQ